MIPCADWTLEGRARWRAVLVGEWGFGPDAHPLTGAEFDLVWLVETGGPGSERFLR